MRRLIGYLAARPAGVPCTDAPRAATLACRLFRASFEAETGGSPCSAASDSLIAERVFRTSPSSADALVWLRAQAALFLRYAPVAAKILPPDTDPEDVPHRLMVWDALALLRHANTALRGGDLADAYHSPARVPFGLTYQHARFVSSIRSTDVNLGATILSLAIESRIRASAVTPFEAEGPLWQGFRAMIGRNDLPVDLGLLVTVYNWAARHRRAGSRPFVWLNYFANDLLEPFFAAPCLAEGRRPEGSATERPEECVGRVAVGHKSDAGLRDADRIPQRQADAALAVVHG
jgi:hypothetical protein